MDGSKIHNLQSVFAGFHLFKLSNEISLMISVPCQQSAKLDKSVNCGYINSNSVNVASVCVISPNFIMCKLCYISCITTEINLVSRNQLSFLSVERPVNTKHINWNTEQHLTKWGFHWRD